MTRQDAAIPISNAPGLFGVETFEGPWVLLHTKSRQEKVVAEELRLKGIPHFSPLLSVTRYHGKRKARVEQPLFPSYVFLHGPVELAWKASLGHRLANIIPIATPDKVADELFNLALALSQGGDLDPYPKLVKGARVEVRGGPFMGLQGVVTDRLRLDRIFLQVGILGRSASLEVDASVVELVR